MESSDSDMLSIGNWQQPCNVNKELPFHSISTVTVHTAEDDGSLWVMPQSDREKLEIITSVLEGLMPPDELPPVSVGQTCAAFFSDGKWYRACVVSTEPEIIVHFIDYGNKSVVSPDEITSLPPSITIYPPLANKIQLPADCPLQPREGDILKVTPVAKRGEMTIVDVIEEQGSVFSELKCVPVSADIPAAVNLAENCNSAGSETFVTLSSVQEPVTVSTHPGITDEYVSLTTPLPSRQSLCPDLILPHSLKAAEDVPEKVSEDGISQDGGVIEAVEHTREKLLGEVSNENRGVERESSSGVEVIAQSSERCDLYAFKNDPEISSALSKSKDVSVPETVVFDSKSLPDSIVGENTELLGSAIEAEAVTESNTSEIDCYYMQGESINQDSSDNRKAGTLRDQIINATHQEMDVNAAQGTGGSSISNFSFGENNECSVDRSSSNDSAKSADESQVSSAFIAALGRYPHLGGGYGANQIDCSNEERFSASEVPKYGRNNVQSQPYVKNVSSGNYYTDNDSDWQSVSTSSTRGSSPMPRGRNQPASVGRSIRSQNHSSPHARSGEQTHNRATYPSPSPYQNPRSSVSTGAQKLQRSSGAAVDGGPVDYKAKLEFELAILREQNRLQMLQMQQQMDERHSHLTQKLSKLHDEMVRQMAVFRNEVNSRLLVINENVVQKMAQFYTDLASLRNDIEMNKSQRSSNVSRNRCNVETKPDCQYMPGDNQQKQLSHLGSASHHSSSETRNVDNRSHSQNNRPQSSQHMGQGDFYQQSSKERNFSESETSSSLMNLRKEKMAEREHLQMGQYQQHQYQQKQQHQQNSQHQYFNQSNHQTERGPPDQQKQNKSNYPRVDHFDPNQVDQVQGTKWGGYHKGSGDSETPSKSGSGNIICVANFDPEKTTPETLFNLFGLYGNVQRVKLSHSDKGRGFIEMADAAQAEAAIQHLGGVSLMGHTLQVMPCNFDRLNITRIELQTNASKDYSKPNSLKYHRFKPGSWNAARLYPPSEKLLISNILRTVSDDKIKEVFAKKGFNLLSVQSYPANHEEKKFAFVQLASVDEAVTALAVMHHQELTDWMQMRITFGKQDSKKYSDAENRQMV